MEYYLNNNIQIFSNILGLIYFIKSALLQTFLKMFSSLQNDF